MKKYTLAAAVISLMALLPLGAAQAHDVSIPVIIDTDAALDDMRAIVLLLQDGHFDVRAAVTSDGACDPETGAGRISRLLAFMGKGYIPVGAGTSLGLQAPPWREMSESSGQDILGGADAGYAGKSAAAVISGVLSDRQTKVTYVCLGPLTNLAAAIAEDPSLAHGIEAVYYYGILPVAANSGKGRAEAGSMDSGTGEAQRGGGAGLTWNTERDLASAETIASSGLTVYSCALPDSLLLTFDGKLYRDITSFDGKGAKLARALYSEGKASRLLSQRHFTAWDETVALCLIEPLLADFQETPGAPGDYRLASFDTAGARNIYEENYKYAGTPAAYRRKTVVFESFPTGPELMRPDVRPLVRSLIEKHGLEEWRSAVLTNEIHRHLGIYSIIGVKMGLRAREILGATLDDLRVKSSAGQKPPISCMNDGLQVSTGASLGRGTISIAGGTAAPEALFTSKNGSVRLKLKEEVVERIKSDIKAAIGKYGNLTPEYFAEIRRLSLGYWLELDRGEIFVEQRTGASTQSGKAGQ